MTTRASIIIWSAGSGLLLGVFIDAAMVGIWVVVSSVVPAMAPRQVPRWYAALAVLALAAIPIAVGILGYLEGRLKTD
jgi:hypothetical protein